MFMLNTVCVQVQTWSYVLGTYAFIFHGKHRGPWMQKKNLLVVFARTKVEVNITTLWFSKLALQMSLLKKICIACCYVLFFTTQEGTNITMMFIKAKSSTWFFSLLLLVRWLLKVNFSMQWIKKAIFSKKWTIRPNIHLSLVLCNTCSTDTKLHIWD